MNCNDIIGKICDDLSEDINSEVCQEIKAHLENCVDCQAQLSSMKNTVNLFKCLELKKVPNTVHERLVKLLNVESL